MHPRLRGRHYLRIFLGPAPFCELSIFHRELAGSLTQNYTVLDKLYSARGRTSYGPCARDAITKRLACRPPRGTFCLPSSSRRIFYLIRRGSGPSRSQPRKPVSVASRTRNGV